MEGANLRPLGIEDNARFSIAFMLKTSIVFFPEDNNFIYKIAEIFKSYEQKSKNSFFLYLVSCLLLKLFYAECSEPSICWSLRIGEFLYFVMGTGISKQKV